MTAASTSKLPLAFATLASPATAATNSTGIELMDIPAGSFQMGSMIGHWNEQPARKVTISRLPRATSRSL